MCGSWALLFLYIILPPSPFGSAPFRPASSCNSFSSCPSLILLQACLYIPLPGFPSLQSACLTLLGAPPLGFCLDFLTTLSFFLFLPFGHPPPCSHFMCFSITPLVHTTQHSRSVLFSSRYSRSISSVAYGTSSLLCCSHLASHAFAAFRRADLFSPFLSVLPSSLHWVQSFPFPSDAPIAVF